MITFWSRLFAGLTVVRYSEFTSLAAKLAYGADSAPLLEDRVRFQSKHPLLHFPLQLTSYPLQISITQSISGTGALRIGTAFFARHYPGAKTIYLPTPTWGNHIPISKDAGLEVKQYTYFDKKTVGLDFEGMKKDIAAAPEGSVILLHACAHNVGPGRRLGRHQACRLT